MAQHSPIRVGIFAGKATFIRSSLVRRSFQSALVFRLLFFRVPCVVAQPGLVAPIGPHIGVMSPSPQNNITDVRGVRVIAFSAAPEVRVADSAALQPTLPNERMSPLFIATIEATEEALNSLFAAETMGQRPYRRGCAAHVSFPSYRHTALSAISASGLPDKRPDPAHKRLLQTLGNRPVARDGK